MKMEIEEILNFIFVVILSFEFQRQNNVCMECVYSFSF